MSLEVIQMILKEADYRSTISGVQSMHLTLVRQDSMLPFTRDNVHVVTVAEATNKRILRILRTPERSAETLDTVRVID